MSVYALEAALPVGIALRELSVLQPDTLSARVQCRVDIDASWAGAGVVSVWTAFREGALGSFVRELRGVYASLKGEARLEPDGEGARVTIRALATSPGNVEVDCVAASEDHEGSRKMRLEFTGLPTDQSYLPEVIRAFEERIQELGEPGV